MSFTGFPVAALDFYDDLEIDNTKSFWEAHKARLDESVKAPMAALVAALEAEFGDAKVFRPYRDVRFAKDKTPYKTHQGAFVARRRRAPAGTSRCRRAGSAPAPASTTPTARSSPPSATAVADDRTGTELEQILAALEARGLRGRRRQLKTAPRGYDRTTRGSSCCGTSSSSPAGRSASSRSSTPPSCSSWSATTGGPCAPLVEWLARA